jgi:hypothetical protein
LIKSDIRSTVLLVIVSLASSLTFGQGIYSPYSKFGIGRMYPVNNLFTMAMGGTTVGIRTPLYVNPYNPASYTALDSTSFIFDAALTASFLTLKTATASDQLKEAGLGYITMGFPVTKWWKASFGLLPYSSSNYQIGFDSLIEDIGNVRFRYTGNGGLNRAYIGNAFLITGKLSAGFNLGYIFGTLNRERTVSFPDSGNHFNSRLTNSYLIRNIYLDFGIQYHTTLKNGMFICSGLTAAPGQSLSSSYDFLATSFYHNDISNLDVTKDTSVFETGVNGKIKMPSSIGLGLSLGKTNRWLLAADVQYTQWSSYKFFGSSDSLKNTLRVTFGGQYKPSAVDIGSYWKRINYRAGIRFEESFLELKNKKLNEIGVSVGFSLPLKKSRSTLNFAFETGTFGTIDNLLIKENFFKISVGASLYEKWFIKRKYD